MSRPVVSASPWFQSHPTRQCNPPRFPPQPSFTGPPLHVRVEERVGVVERSICLAHGVNLYPFLSVTNVVSLQAPRYHLRGAANRLIHRPSESAQINLDFPNLSSRPNMVTLAC